MPEPFFKPYRFRNIGTAAACLLVVAIVLGGLGVLTLLPAKYPGQKSGLPVMWAIGLGVSALCGCCAFYSWGFEFRLDHVGVYAKTRWPFKTRFLPWSELARVDHFGQQRRLGLGGKPANVGAPLGKISGFRFWPSEGPPIVLGGQSFTHLENQGVVARVFNEIVAPTLRTLKGARLVVRTGGAASESPFRGTLDRVAEGVRDVRYQASILEATTDAGKEAIAFPGAPVPAGDLVLIELAWGRPMDVGNGESA